MAYPDKLLTRGERVVLHKHPSWKALILPTVFFIIIIGGGSFLASVIRNWQNHTGRGISWIAIGVVGVLLLILLVIVPFIRWRTEHFVITNFHIFFRTGIIRHRQHQIPLANIQNIETNVSVFGRLLGYGTLIVESAADQPLEFQNVGSIGHVQSTLNQLIQDERSGRGFDAEGMIPDRRPPQPGPGGTQVMPPQD